MAIRPLRLIPSLRDLFAEVGAAVSAAEEYKRAYGHREGGSAQQSAAQRATSGIPL